MAILNTVQVIIDNQIMTVLGGEFVEMLDAVKSINGRIWIQSKKVWQLPCSLAEAKEILADFQILENEDQVIDEEILRIKKYQGWILEDISKIEEEYQILEQGGGGYSVSAGRNKAAKKTMAYCLRMAIVAAKKTTDTVTKPEISGMKRACEIMGWV